MTWDVHWLPIYKPWNSEAFGQGDKKVWTINCQIQLCSLIEAFDQDDKKVWTINCPIQLCSLIEAFDQDDKKCGHLIAQFNCVP